MSDDDRAIARCSERARNAIACQRYILDSEIWRAGHASIFDARDGEACIRNGVRKRAQMFAIVRGPPETPMNQHDESAARDRAGAPDIGNL
jgi:hypothetical protein